MNFLFLKMRQCNTNGRKLNETNITSTPFCKHWRHIGSSICLLGMAKLPALKSSPGPALIPIVSSRGQPTPSTSSGPPKRRPYRIALANGFIANDWRVQMIQVAKAYAEQPDVAEDIKEFKVISVGEDIAAQIAAVNNFIDQGFDAVIVNANNPTAFGGVVKKANEAGVVLLSFDNVIDDPDEHPDQRRSEGPRRSRGRIPAEEANADPAKFLLRARSCRPAG